MKCLPLSKIPQAKGVVLHDWHAEILALRAFNHFLIQECHELARSPAFSSLFLRRRKQSDTHEHDSPQPFKLRDGLKLHMYCSEAPCGDASMELTMGAQEDPTPWPEPAGSATESNSEETKLLGRGYFSQLGIVRRKPCGCLLYKPAILRSGLADDHLTTARPDAPQSLSKSCSDKLALKQCTSLLSSPASLLILPEDAHLHSLILPSTQYSERACQRSFSVEGRMKPLRDKTWEGGYSFRPFEVRTTDREFAYSRRSIDGTKTPSNLSAVYTPRLQERLVNGVLQGRKQFSPQGASVLCKQSMWMAVAEVIALLGIPTLQKALSYTSYMLVKGDGSLEDRRKVKEEVRREALEGWVRNGGEDFTLFSSSHS